MPRDFVSNVADWYWLADDGQVFSSKVMAVVPASDSGYVSHLATDTLATVWPRNDTGEQNVASIYAVLAHYGLAVPPGMGIVPSVSSAQAKIQCLRTPGSEKGKTLLDDIATAVAGAGGEVAIWFAEARTWDRFNPYVTNLSSSLNLPPADVDKLFISASQIAA